MEKLKYSVGNDETLKWRHAGKAFCLHVMRDDAPLSPLESDSIVKLAFFGNKSALGNDGRTKNVDPIDYLVQLCRENVEPAAVVSMIEDRKLDGLTVERLDGGLITVRDETDGDTFESFMPGAIIDVLADGMTFTRCDALLKAVVHVEPVWAYEHSGLTVSVGPRGYPYNDQWDSYQIGYAVVTKSDVLTNWPDAEAEWDGLAEKAIKGVVDEFDKYLAGDVWGYQLYELDGTECDVKREPDWKETESTWGFIGHDIFESGMADSVGNGLEDAFKANAVESGTAVIRTVLTTLFGAPPKPSAEETRDRPDGTENAGRSDDGLRPFTVTVQRTGCATVMARSGIDAMDIADGIGTNAVSWEDGWTVTDVRPAED